MGICYVYMMSNRKNGIIYVGFAKDVQKRTIDHKVGKYAGFSKKYRTDRLVYFETHADIDSALMREKQLKKWNRKWKIDLIDRTNPNWNDLFGKLPIQHGGIEILRTLSKE